MTTPTLSSISLQLTDIINTLERRLGSGLVISAKQMVTLEGLSDIDSRLGLIQAGEFRTGNGKLPGDGFTGGRFGFPGFVYGSETYFLAGVLNDVLQVGLSITDGTIKAGAGDVTIDGGGIWIENQQAAFGFKDTNGDRGNLIIYSDASNNFVISNKTGTGGFFVDVDSATHKVLELEFAEDPTNAEVPRILIRNTLPSSSAAALYLDTGVILWAGVDGKETVFNEDSFDVDFRIESATHIRAFLVDAGAELISMFGLVYIDGGTDQRLEIGVDHFIPVHTAPNPNVYFNETNEDMDFHVEGTTDANLLNIDAGLNAIGMGGAAESGYKLKVTGSAKITDGLTWNGWDKRTETWTRTGNHTFTIATDLTAIYRKGTKVRDKDGGGFEYGVISSSAYSSPNTTVTLITTTDYAMAAATITDTYLSFTENPEGFPSTFNFTIGYTGFSVNPTTTKSAWRTVGAHINILYVQNALGTSNAATFTLTGLPVAIATATVLHPTIAFGADNSANLREDVNNTPSTLRLDISGTTISLGRNANGLGDWTTSGTKGVYALDLWYEF